MVLTPRFADDIRDLNGFGFVDFGNNLAGIIDPLGHHQTIAAAM